MPTSPPTSAGGCAACAPTLPLFAEYERRLRTPSDIQQHLPELFRWAATQHDANVVELGTRSGNSTAAFLAACELRGRGFVWSFDLAPADVPWELTGPHWSFRQLDALGVRAQAAAPDLIDVLFIDLDPHSFEQTADALRLWVPRVRPGGVVLCHDTEWPEINARCPDPHDSGVGRALDDFCRERGLSWENRAGNNGLGVLRVPCGHD